MRMRALIGATLLAWVALPALALVALADEDPPLRPVDAGPPLRPPLTALRAVERAPSASAGPNASKKELIVLVGGYASEQEQQVFGTFRDRIAPRADTTSSSSAAISAPTTRSARSMRARCSCATPSERCRPATASCTS